MEHMEQRSLFEVIKQSRNGHFVIPWKQRCTWILHSALGLGYLHDRKPPLCHQDIKSLNLLINEHGLLKVSDLGSCFSKAHSAVWMAPETIVDGSYDTASDVYSLGVVMWELLTLTTPHSDLWALLRAGAGNQSELLATLDAQFEESVKARIRTGGRPPSDPYITKDTPPEFVELMNECMAANPKRRPPASEIVDRINAMIVKYSDLWSKQEMEMEISKQKPVNMMIPSVC